MLLKESNKSLLNEFFYNEKNILAIPTICLSIILILFSLVIIKINTNYYHYVGNNYFPSNILYVGIILILNYLGIYLMFGKKNNYVKQCKELIYFFSIMLIIALITNAVQFTPYSPIDNDIYNSEKFFLLDIVKIITWTKQHTFFRKFLDFVYDTLAWQMCYLPLLLIITKKYSIIREYYFLLLSSALLGFAIYYFFPTTAPASILDANLFSDSQKATYLKFYQIHNYIKPTTLDGGLIAFPSFHAIWGWLCVYILRDWPVLFKSFLVLNFFLILSCVLCGWHYILDIIIAFLIILICHLVVYIYKSKVSFHENYSTNITVKSKPQIPSENF